MIGLPSCGQRLARIPAGNCSPTSIIGGHSPYFRLQEPVLDNSDIFSQVETQLTVSKLHNAWHPEIVYDVHQMGDDAARLFVPPWLDPAEPNIDRKSTRLNSSHLGIS